jgi:phosphoribosylanthranilate isomerase
MKLKVCGITTTSQLQALDALGIDYAGLIFYKNSPRYMGDQLPPEAVQALSLNLKKTGVFVNEAIEKVAEKIVMYGLDAVQLHGNESPEYCDTIKRSATVIKVFSVGKQEISEAVLMEYAAVSDYFLFDTATTAHGGSGRQFDWNKLHDLNIPLPFFLSGGIGPDDALAVKQFQHSNCYAIDVNSRFETSPGMKNMDEVAAFWRAIQLV